ncbi:MAG TPA: YSC84-related protein, partial [Gemmatimonadales bacterium]|nr:YSC84-related protein [Gemmatimonadales bacterium]
MIRVLALAAVAAGVRAPAVIAQDNVPPVIAKFKQKDPRVAREFDRAYGYVVFPTVGKGAIGIGGARGKGWVYERGRRIGKATLTQVTVGFQLGGQAYSEVIFFKDKAALADFTRGSFEFDAQVSAIAVNQRAAGDLPYRKGVAVVTMGKGGLMYEASV